MNDKTELILVSNATAPADSCGRRASLPGTDHPLSDIARVIATIVGMGRLTLSRRERMVMVEPRGSGMTLFTLRAAEEVRAAQFGSAEGDLDVEMVAITRPISDSAPGHSTRADTATAIKRHYGS